jgi:hypothetical protein
MIIYTINLFEKIIFEHCNVKFTKIKNRCIVEINNMLWIVRKIFKNSKCVYINEFDFKNNFFLIQFLIDSGESLEKEKLCDVDDLPELDDECEIYIDKFSKTALKFIAL